MLNYGNCKNVRMHISAESCLEMQARSAHICQGCDGPLPARDAEAVKTPACSPPHTSVVISFAGYEGEFEKLRQLSEADGHNVQEDMLTILLLFIGGRLLVLDRH
jgi:hypothetical protein